MSCIILRGSSVHRVRYMYIYIYRCILIITGKLIRNARYIGGAHVPTIIKFLQNCFGVPSRLCQVKMEGLKGIFRFQMSPLATGRA